MRLKTGDTVVVIRGKEKGKTGKILAVYPKKNQVKIDGINKVKIHKKSQVNPADSGIFEEFLPMDASKVGIQHPTNKKTSTRLGVKIDGKGKKKRVMKANGKEV